MTGLTSPGIAILSWWRGLRSPVIPRAIPSGATLLVGSPMAGRSRGRFPDNDPWRRGQDCEIWKPLVINWHMSVMALFHCMVRYSSLSGGFPTKTARGGTKKVPGTVPGTFLVPPRPGFQAIRTVTKTWRVNSTDHGLAGENHHYCVTELASRDPT